MVFALLSCKCHFSHYPFMTGRFRAIDMPAKFTPKDGNENDTPPNVQTDDQQL